jgi:CBS domain containing-hemolysin-like protein
MSPAVGLPAVAVLVLANGFFVAAEFALVAVRRSRLEQLAREGHAAARAALDVVAHLDTYIAACQLGITMTSLGLGWIGEPALASLIEAPLRPLLGRFTTVTAHAVAVPLAFAAITALHIVIGELAPKGVALQRPEGTALAVARPLRLFQLAFAWPIRGLNGVGNAVLRLAGLAPATGHDLVHSVEELQLLVHASQRAGVVEASEARIAARAFEFADITAGELMTPRLRIEALPVSLTGPELLARVAAASHSRLPVYEGSLDNVVGAIRARDLLGAAAGDRRLDVRRVLRPVLTIPETRKADDLLDDMRTSGRALAIVIDEYGGTAGLVTLGDLMRALVGRIAEEAAPGTPVEDGAPARREDGSVLLDGLMRIAELEEVLGQDLPELEEADVDTLGGLVMERLDRIAQVGDEVTLAGRRFRVEAVEGRRAALVRLLDPPPPRSAAGDAPAAPAAGGGPVPAGAAPRAPAPPPGRA